MRNLIFNFFVAFAIILSFISCERKDLPINQVWYYGEDRTKYLPPNNVKKVLYGTIEGDRRNLEIENGYVLYSVKDMWVDNKDIYFYLQLEKANSEEATDWKCQIIKNEKILYDDVPIGTMSIFDDDIYILPSYYKPNTEKGYWRNGEIIKYPDFEAIDTIAVVDYVHPCDMAFENGIPYFTGSIVTANGNTVAAWKEGKLLFKEEKKFRGKSLFPKGIGVNNGKVIYNHDDYLDYGSNDYTYIGNIWCDGKCTVVGDSSGLSSGKKFFQSMSYYAYNCNNDMYTAYYVNINTSYLGNYWCTYVYKNTDFLFEIPNQQPRSLTVHDGNVYVLSSEAWLSKNGTVFRRLTTDIDTYRISGLCHYAIHSDIR